MFESLFNYMDLIDDAVWSYIGVPAILVLGLYLSTKGKFMQLLQFDRVGKIFFNFLSKTDGKKDERGIHPLKAFFAAVGGCIGIGNIIVVCTAVQVGGPGAVFWMWVAAFLGMMVKYAEIYVGIKHRVKNKAGGYDGGPMYFLQKATKLVWVPQLVSILLCIYGVDMYMFRTVAHSFTTWWHWNEYAVIAGLLAAVIMGGEDGVERVGTISSAVVPVFLLMFTACSGYVFIKHWQAIPGVFADIFYSAFSPKAAVGAFTGVGLLTTIAQGMKRACYTGDIGIGYASIIHSETDEPDPARQASLGIFGIFLDTFVVCTISVLLILVTGVWQQGVHADQAVAHVLGHYIPRLDLIWPIFIFLLGYSSLLAVFTSGMKAAKFLHPKHGPALYNIYAIVMFLLFSFIGTDDQILTAMSLIGALLLIINLLGIIALRKDIVFKLPKKN